MPESAEADRGAQPVDYRAAKADFEALEPVVDVVIWHDANPTRTHNGRKTVSAGVAKRIVVEAHDVNDSHFLIDTMKEYRLVITDFTLGKTGFRASLRPVEGVY